jgi:integrase
MRRRTKLTARGVAALTTPGRHSDGGNLYLSIDAKGRKRWTFMYVRGGKQRELGLGSAQDVPLVDARALADDARAKLRAGVDPIDSKRAMEKVDVVPTFGAYVETFLAAKESEWRNPKHRAQWRMTLTTYAAPLHGLRLDRIAVADVLAALKPLWQTKPETASRLRGRIEAVLDAAKVAGHRSGENPAAWGGNLEHLLPKRGKLSRGHHAAMAYADVPAFVAQLREREALAALALEFCILTAARSGEVLGARWSEIDFAAQVWTVPAERMKAAREHRIPLSERALAILEKLSEARTGELVFPGQRAGRPLSAMAMEMLLRRMDRDTVTVHGFRSAFRDWAGNETHFAREVAEAALAHVVGDKAEQAYRRGDALEKRRALMSAWGAYVDGPHEAKVIQLHGAAR